MNNQRSTDLGPVRTESAQAPSGTRAFAHIETAPAHPYALGRRFRLGKNRQFQYVYRRGKSFPGRQMVLIYVKARELRVGFSVSAKVGNSVVRSRVKRRMREDFRLLRPRLKPGKYVFVARNAAASADAASMGKTMRYLLNKARLFVEDAPSGASKE